MTVTLLPVYDLTDDKASFLYGLLEKRSSEPVGNLKLDKLPSWADHIKYIQCRPYAFWAIVCLGEFEEWVGSVTIDYDGTVGVYVIESRRLKGIAREAVGQAMDVCRKRNMTKFRAVIRSENAASQGLFRSLGFKSDTITMTYQAKPCA